MKYIDPRTNIEQDTATIPIPLFVGLLRYLAKSHASNNFFKINHSLTLADFARAFRGRCFRDQHNIYGSLRALLNQIDPPRCRCGKPGTRIIGSVTFCTKCGPPPNAKARFDQRRRLREQQSVDIYEQRRAVDYHDLSGHAQKRGGKQWKGGIKP